MDRLEKLKNITTRSELATLLGYTSKSISYILYQIPEDSKYFEFQIPKSNGGQRTLKAPVAELKLLQKRLSNYLQDCVDEINSAKKVTHHLSHGFRRKTSILHNAQIHRNKRFVVNLDLEDFFGSINFGRVRGFFLKNRNFELNERVATVIAQIACHTNSLPQGSPCSPIISNLIGHLLDIKLVKYAARNGLIYSRYADDLTFSTNHKTLPDSLVSEDSIDHCWQVGSELEKIINHSGYRVNYTKTRVQYKDSRQDVTGLVVNKKINSRSEYWREVRAQVDTLVKKGVYTNKTTIINKNGESVEVDVEGSLNQLQGKLSFINQMDLYNQSSGANDELNTRQKTYRKFLYHKFFYSNPYPHIICEGKTDSIYLKSAVLSLAENYPDLVRLDGDKVKPALSFHSYTETNNSMLALTGGVATLMKFYREYIKYFDAYSPFSLTSPVILLFDHDAEVRKIVLKQVKNTLNIDNFPESGGYYHCFKNIYLIILPKIDKKSSDTVIEDYFDDDLLKTTINGKTFNKTNKPNDNQYGKHIFSINIIKKNKNEIDFSRFSLILDLILAVKEHYKSFSTIK